MGNLFKTLISVVFLLNSVTPLQAQELSLPKPGVMVHLSPAYNPPILKGIKVHPENPFKFEFIMDRGDSKLNVGNGLKPFPTDLRSESQKLIKYFLASLTIPEKDLWVNLSPYEKDRIVPDAFGQTEMGRDLLAQDYMLKQITASLIYPEDEIGKKFWKRIYEESAKKSGTTNISVNTFNKVWIVPEKAVIYENSKAGTAYVVESRLKVMLEQDYLALEKNEEKRGKEVRDREINKQAGDHDSPAFLKRGLGGVNELGSQIVREIVIPVLTKEVNSGQNFAQLRQVYNSLILATWYKKKIKDSILAQVYANKNKVKGLSSPNALISDPEHIYQRYLQAFRKGTYNYIKEETDPNTQQSVPRKYFSGGVEFSDHAMVIAFDEVAELPSTLIIPSRAMIIDVKINEIKIDRAMFNKSQQLALERLRILGRRIQPLIQAIEDDPDHWRFILNNRFLNDIQFWGKSDLERTLTERRIKHSSDETYFSYLKNYAKDIYNYSRWILENSQYKGKKIIVLGRAADPIYDALMTLTNIDDSYKDRNRDIFLIDFSSRKIRSATEGNDEKVKAYREFFRDELRQRGISFNERIVFVNEVSHETKVTPEYLKLMMLRVPFDYTVAVEWQNYSKQKGRSFDGKSDQWHWADWLDLNYKSGRDYKIWGNEYIFQHQYTETDLLQRWLNQEIIYLEGLNQVRPSDGSSAMISKKIDAAMNVMAAEAFGQMLRVAREAKGWSQEELAKKITTSASQDLQVRSLWPSEISKYEGGKLLPRDVKLKQLADLLDLNLGDLLMRWLNARGRIVERDSFAFMMILGRVNMNWTQEDVAWRMLVGQPDVSKYENGEVPSEKRVLEFTRIYKLNPHDSQELIQAAKIQRDKNKKKITEVASAKGGIDLSSDETLTVQNNGQGIKFHIDPAQLKEFQNAPGFTPVIINIQPMTNIRQFLDLHRKNSTVTVEI